MEYFRPEVKVGALIFVSLALFVFAALTIGNLGAWFTEQHTYTVLFPNANLLHRRAKVAYAGFPVGEVTAITIRDLSLSQQHGYPVAVTVVVDARDNVTVTMTVAWPLLPSTICASPTLSDGSVLSLSVIVAVPELGLVTR